MTQPLPIRQWRIANLKAVERAELDLAPLTVLVGANSSGKSTVLQSILLAVQAAQARVPGGVFPLNGPLVQMGEFADAHSAFAPGRRTAIGGVFDLGTGVEGDRSTADWQVEFAGKVPSQPGSARLTSVSLSLGEGTGRHDRRRRLAIRAREGEAGRSVPIVGSRGASSLPVGALNLVAWPGTVNRDGPRTTRIHGLSLVAGFPTHYLVQADEHDVLAAMWITRLWSQVPPGSSRRDRGTHLGTGVSTLIDALASDAASDIRLWLAGRPGAPSWEDVPEFRSIRGWTGVRRATKVRGILSSPEAEVALRTAVASRLGPGGSVLMPMVLDEVALGPLRLLAERVSYLGPLRQEPQVVYRTISSLQPRFLGTRGEYLAPVLHGLRHEMLTVPMPGGQVETVRLQDALNAWLTYLEAASSIESHDTGRLGFDLRVTLPDLQRSVDLMSVGVGVSQVVPVIMVCLLAEAGSVVLLEQPELHLHPAMQQRLGDFFLALAGAGRQVIIETHSEYLLTRLRRRVAEDDSDRTSELVRIVNASKLGGRTRLDPVPVNRYGSIEDWPEGFFDQATDDARLLLHAGLAKRDIDE